MWLCHTSGDILMMAADGGHSLHSSLREIITNILIDEHCKKINGPEGSYFYEQGWW